MTREERIADYMNWRGCSREKAENEIAKQDMFRAANKRYEQKKAAGKVQK